MRSYIVTHRTPLSRLVAVAATSVLALSLAACSNDSGGSDDASGAPETLTIGTSGTFRPITFSDGGELTGFDIAVGNEIAERMGTDAEFVEGQLAGLIPGLNNDQFDAVMSGLTETDERRDAVDFSVPYHAEGTVAVVASASAATTDATELSGLRVGAISGSGSEGDVEEIGGYDSYTGYPGTPEGISDLIAGRIDVFATGRVAAQAYIDTAADGDSLEIVGDTYHLLPVAIALPLDGDQERLDQINEALNSMIDDGTLEELQQEWLGFIPTIPEQ
jgi:ABC-type amino acid transport substrate-binding protein